MDVVLDDEHLVDEEVMANNITTTNETGTLLDSNVTADVV
jgi:hypothetical protein